MTTYYLDLLKKRLDNNNLTKLLALNNPSVFDFVGECVELCRPKAVFIQTDSQEDIDYIRRRAKELGEEKPLSIKGHTVHFDGYFDQARDKKNTKYLLPPSSKSRAYVNTIEKDEGLREIRGYLKGIMKEKEMFVCFFCLGPLASPFSILAVQVTDSAYAAHSENILYRCGYEEIKKNRKKKFFKFIHSAGELQGGLSKNIGQRRIYIDLQEDIVYSVNTQYAGNAVGLKKLALRLAIHKASWEGWLAEHMFIMGIHNQENSKAYFCGAYPSMCGKTSTALALGESIVGDDIAYLRIIEGRVYAANAERGVFGIIKDINSQNDPSLFRVLSEEGEVIFSNICVDENNAPFWSGKYAHPPSRGVNFSGKWFPGKTDSEGEEIPPSHKNARYTIRLTALNNFDESLDSPQGVEIKGIIYGGRDSDTSSPVEEALSWQQGVIMKAASLESETTAATLDQEGIRVFNPMSNIDFISIPLGKYIQMHLDFGKKLKAFPLIFSVNYFLKNKQGKFLNDIEDKRVWLKWMRLRVEGKAGALRTPTGLIPKYEDLKKVFKEILNKDYLYDDYLEQFTLRIPEHLERIERITNIYKDLDSAPCVLFEELAAQEERLRNCQQKYGDYVLPLNFRAEESGEK